MRTTARHLAVFLLMMVAAYAVSYAVPDEVDPKRIFRGFTLAFLLYLALSLLVAIFRSGSSAK